MTKAPVILIGLWGTEKVWPRSSRLPNVLNVSNPPEVRIRRRPSGRAQVPLLDADTKRIMKALAKLLPAEARKQVKPTAEQLAATYPPGYKSDPEKESKRRPGTD